MTSLIFDVIGKDHASKVFKDVGDAAKGAEGKMSKLKAAGAVAFAALAVGAVDFAKKSIDKFQDVGTETLTLQRQLGLTATQASRLRFAGEETGVAATTLGTGFGILSKHMSANDKAWKSLGISTVDAHGKTKSMNDLIPEIADKFAKLPNGAQKTALSMNLFGRNGKALLPFLNKGAAGIKDLEKESDKYGDTLNDKDTKAVHANIIAKRQLNAAVSGLEIQLGEHLLPAVTSVVTGFTSLVTWFSHLGTTGKTIIGIVAALVAVIATIVEVTKVWTAVQTAFNVVMDANPIVLIVIGLAALAVGLVYAYKKSQTFRDIVNGVFNSIKAVVSTVVGFIKDHWKLLFGILTGPVGLAVVFISGHWDTVKGLFKGAAKVFGKLLGGLESALISPFTSAFKVILSGFGLVEGAINSVLSLLPGHTPTGTFVVHNTKSSGGGLTTHTASGTSNFRGGMTWLAENGPERVWLPAGAQVSNARQTRQGSGTVIHNHNVTLNLSGMVGDKRSLGAEIVKALQAYQGSTGRPLQITTT